MWCALYFGCLLITGFGVAAIFADKCSAIERCALICTLGPAAMGLCLIALSMMGLVPSRFSIFGCTALWLIVGIFFRRRFSRSASAIPKPEMGWLVLFLIAAGYAAYVVAANAMLDRTLEWDAFAIWQLKSKILATHALNPMPVYFHSLSLSFSHLRYPILVPMISAGEHAMSGSINDELEKSPSLLLYIGLSAAVLALLRDWRGNGAAMFGTALLMTTPTLLKYAGSGTAEMGLTAFYACSLVSILRWHRMQRTADLALAAIFSACMVWTKNEGAALAAINLLGVALLAPPPVWRRFLAPLGVAAIIILLYLPWILFLRHVPKTDENYSVLLTPANLLRHLGRIPIIARYFGGELCNLGQWTLFWFVLPAIAFVDRRRFFQRPIWVLWLLLILHLLAYFPPIMVVQNWNVMELLTTTSDRLMLHITPIVAILIGMHWPFRPAPVSTTFVPTAIQTKDPRTDARGSS